MWNNDLYKNWLRNRLIEIKKDLDFDSFNIEVYNEQDYMKDSDMKPKTISVVIKYLSSSIIFNTRSQPLQILILSEENSLSVANSIFTALCEKYNFYCEIEGDTYIKHQYSNPVVLSNFQMVGSGLRSVLYSTCDLFILEDVLDIKNLYIDTNKVEALSVILGYTMNGDSQPFSNKFVETTKNFAIANITIKVACIKTEFTEKVIKIMNGTYDGNENFIFDFDVGEFSFEYTMKLQSSSLSSAINGVPSLELTFTV